jgi:hypothetical protein
MLEYLCVAFFQANVIFRSIVPTLRADFRHYPQMLDTKHSSVFCPPLGMKKSFFLPSDKAIIHILLNV